MEIGFEQSTGSSHPASRNYSKSRSKDEITFRLQPPDTAITPALTTRIPTGVSPQRLTVPVADRQPLQLQRTLPATAQAGDAAVQLPVTEQQFQPTNTATNAQPLSFLDS